MKANQKFLNKNSDEAVSPVIAVILMVAITVVLAATVYVWVSGFGASGNQAKTLSVSQGNTPTYTVDTASSLSFTVVSVSSNFACNALKVTDSSHSDTWTSAGNGTGWTLKDGSSCTSTPIAGGDVLTIAWPAQVGSGLNPQAGDSINFIDTGSNTVIATITSH